MPNIDTSLSLSALTDDLPSQRSDATIALEDIVEGFARSWIWSALAVQDIKLRYRGSLLGPFWITISTAVMALAMGLIFSRIFHQPVASYLPFLVSGLVVWQFVLAVVTEGCQTFLAVANVIQQVPMPFSIQAFRTVFRNLAVLAHNSVIVLIGILWFHVPINWTILEIVPALFVLCINGIWISILLGMISARFRDMPPIVTNFVQVLFFVTPIFWSADQLGRWKTVAELNPLFAAVDILRAPLIGQSPAPYSWLIMLCATAIGCGVTFQFFARFRSRIAYWV